MNDYKRLTDNLRSYSQDLVAYKLGCAFADAVDAAADAIEQLGKDNAVLTKQRDAAIADLRYQSACWNCTKNGKKCHMNMPMEVPYVMCGKFEWRGVQEVEHETD